VRHLEEFIAKVSACQISFALHVRSFHHHLPYSAVGRKC
jgi:hypothetical protein